MVVHATNIWNRLLFLSVFGKLLGPFGTEKFPGLLVAESAGVPAILLSLLE
jgi:hypothetical protein